MTRSPALDGRLAALLAAALFGGSTPAAKALVGGGDPLVLAGLFYAGSAILLLVFRLASAKGWQSASRSEALRLTGAITCGGVLAPICLLSGLQRTSATAAAMLLTLEVVFTAWLAHRFLGEGIGRRLTLALATVLVGAVLVGAEGMPRGEPLGVLAVAAACLFWAIDNTLTRDVRDLDADVIVIAKGGVGGGVSLGLALLLGRSFPPLGEAGLAMVVGALGYGASLLCFVLALRRIGAARSATVFATAPGFGVLGAILFLGETPGPRLLIGGAFLAAGLWVLRGEEGDGATGDPDGERRAHPISPRSPG